MKILARNWRGLGGELDIVALEQQTIVFIEVRSFFGAFDPVSRPIVSEHKQHVLSRTAVAFLRRHRLLGRSARIDVAALHWRLFALPTIHYYRAAFEPSGFWQA
ncbi:MAG: YraN family protein [Gemmataceae bacterium]